MASSTQGNCYLCGAKLGKTAMKNHILKCHSGEDGQKCRLLKIEGAYDKDYWLYVDIPIDKTLNALDKFLRKIWLECCGHMSEFQGAGMGTKIGRLRTGDQLLHLYDFGSTTETLVTVIGTTWRPPQKEAVRLLSRNVPPNLCCCKCGAPAIFVDTESCWEGKDPFYCKKCAKKFADEDMLLPVTNSPRMGVCAYDGGLDTFAFVQPECKSVSAPQTSAPRKPRKQPENIVVDLYPDELYELAFAFRRAKPWDRLNENELFAIPLPNGETGYCSVMGGSGRHFALAVYPGEPGLRSLQSMQSMQEKADIFTWFESSNPLKTLENMVSHLCIQCSLENKIDMLPEELSSVRSYAARHNIMFRGRHSFPRFVTHRPATYPARVTSEEDIQILCAALRAVLAVNEKLLSGKRTKQALGFSDGLAAARSLPMLVQGQDDYTWSIGMLPDMLPQTYPRPVLRDEILLARLKKTKKQTATWACNVVMFPQPVQEKEDSTPVFPYMLFTADKESGNVFIPIMVRSYEQEADKLLHNLGEQMLESCVPSRIIVTNDRTHALLEALTGSLEITLVQTDEDDQLEDLEDEYVNFLMDGGIEGLDEEGSAELADEFLMGQDDSELLQLPQTVWETLRSMLDEGNASAEAKARYCELNEKRRSHTTDEPSKPNQR